MKKLNKKGFTLVELLAVITIMGILMLVAIPAIARTIENSRRDTFLNTAKTYINAVKSAVSADEIEFNNKAISAAGEGYYYYFFNSADDTGHDLVDEGGKSSWGNIEVKGHILIHKTVGTNGRAKYEYAIIMVDEKGRGIGKAEETTGNPTYVYSESSLKRSAVLSTDGDNRSVFYEKNPNPTKAKTKWNGTSVATEYNVVSIAG